MTLSWNEIKDRALKFSKDWAGTSHEAADAKPFLIDFFSVFGISNRRVSTFEHRVKKLDNKDGYIDLLWKGMILVEMKSRGKNLDQAYSQAKDYLPGLKEHELPKYILVSDFENFRLHDLEEDKIIEFQIKDLVNNVQNFGYLLGYQKKIYKEQDPANIKAAELMARLHDRLGEIGYTGHSLEVYLVRILFCLFAEDTTIFNKFQFQDYIEQRTNPDGNDLAAKLQELFQVLNTPKERRFKNLDEQLAEFPYVNGKLFDELLPTASFDRKMREALLNCCYIDWSKISPAIFGSMFQGVMNPKERRNLGAHYTSESNILKLIKPLFLDELWEEFFSVKDSKTKLPYFHKKLGALQFLDPACGCGNFLVVTYRELRLLEFEVLKALNKSGQKFLDVSQILLVGVDQFSGIEYEEFPARIAEVAMWLIDHQMNMLVSSEFGQYFVRLPLTKSANIVHGNALRMEWGDLLKNNLLEIEADSTTVVLNEPSVDYQTITIKTKNLTIIDERSYATQKLSPKNTFDYIIGNPPFIGSAYQTEAQKSDMESVFFGLKGYGMLDYVAAWYKKAAQMILNTKTRTAFVSTNSITQGEQPGILWAILYNLYKVKIHFAHRTFSWTNEAKGKAAVHVVIIGFANYDVNKKVIYDYQDVKNQPIEVIVKNINPYLVEGKDIVLNSVSLPICQVPKMQSGSAARDGGFLILTDAEKQELVGQSPFIEQYLRRFISGDDFINSVVRWCIWLKGTDPAEFRDIKEFQKRFRAVKEFRETSSRDGTKKMADLPYLFAEERQPDQDFLVIPKVSSENRKYIPIAYLSKDYIVSDKTFVVPNTTLFHFGVMTSAMHMAWMRNTCGRMKSDYSYSNTIVYNNYPWPDNPTDKQVRAIEAAAQKVLDARQLFPSSTLAHLYDPFNMPASLVKAHTELDKAVDTAYRPQAFTNEASRMELLFGLYEKYTAGLFIPEKPKKGSKATIPPPTL
jgi:type I restriction-modification system DNA methylase subunit